MAEAATRVAAPAPATLASAAALALAPVLLTVHNRMRDGVTRSLVFFKKNSAAPADQAPVAWKVLRCPVGQAMRVVLPFSQQIGVFDPRGSHAGLQDAAAGALFEVAAEVAGQGPRLLQARAASAESIGLGSNMVGVSNQAASAMAGHGHAAAMLEVVLYKDGRPLCVHRALAPGALAVFEVLPYMHVALCRGVAEGALLDAATVAAATRISLLGLQSATLDLHEVGGWEQGDRLDQRDRLGQRDDLPMRNVLDRQSPPRDRALDHAFSLRHQRFS